MDGPQKFNIAPALAGCFSVKPKYQISSGVKYMKKSNGSVTIGDPIHPSQNITQGSLYKWHICVLT